MICIKNYGDPDESLSLILIKLNVQNSTKL